MLTRSIFIKTFIFISLIITVYYMYDSPLNFTVIPVNSAKSNYLLYSYGDLDQQLCKRTIDWTRKSSVTDYSKMHECPEYEELVSVASGARTGNLMWAYASVLALANQTGLKAYIPSCLKSSLEKYFDHLSMHDFQDIIHCPVRFETFVTSVEEWKINPQSLILPRYMIYPKEIIPWIPNIWQEFTPNKYLRDSAQETLKKATKNLPEKNYTFVGVHVRRTDYKDYLKRKYNLNLVDPQFFLNAMAYFKQKYQDTLFIFLSDDTTWCSQQFGELENVFVVTDSKNKKDGPGLDLAVMIACNHTIYDYGTFGEWGAILAGGEAVCYDMIQNSKEGSMQYNKSWHLMS